MVVVCDLSPELSRSSSAVRLESAKRVLLVLNGVLLTNLAQWLVILVDELLVDDYFLRRDLYLWRAHASARQARVVRVDCR